MWVLHSANCHMTKNYGATNGLEHNTPLVGPFTIVIR